MRTPPTLLPLSNIPAPGDAAVSAFLPESASADFATIFAELLRSQLVPLNASTPTTELASPPNTNIPRQPSAAAQSPIANIPGVPLAPDAAIADFIDKSSLELFLTEHPSVAPPEQVLGSPTLPIDPTSLLAPYEGPIPADPTSPLPNLMAPVLVSHGATREATLSAAAIPELRIKNNVPTTTKPLDPLTELHHTFAEEFEPSTGEHAGRRLEAFQPFPLAHPRFRGADLTSALRREGLVLEKPLEINVPDFALLDNSRASRIIADKDVLKELDKILGPARTDILDRGASILTPQELSTEASTPSDRNAAALARLDRSEFIERIVQALERAKADAPRSIEIELDPPSLGKLRIQVVEHEGQLTAKIEVSSSATRGLIVDQISTLERTLHEHGLQIQRLQVDSMSTGPSEANEYAGQPGGERDRPFDDRQAPSSGGAPREQGSKEDSTKLEIADLLELADGMDRVI